MSQGYFDADRVPFDGRPLSVPKTSRRRRRRAPRSNHGPNCSANPEIGCVCGYSEHLSDHDGKKAGW